MGLCTGFAAVVLLSGIKLVQHLASPALEASSWWALVLPGVGMLLSGLIVRYLIKDNIGHGVTKVLEAISTNESRIKPHNMFSSVITSILTIGTGGSVGAEAPIVYTGAAIGSNIGRKAGLSFRNITTLVGCGAAGAIAGIFKAPLAGVLFTMEILLFNISLSNMTPLLLSTVSATVISYLFQGVAPSFSCTLEPFAMHNIPFYLALGVLCGFLSLYFTRATLNIEDRFAKFSKPWLKWLIGSLGVGLLVLIFPPLFGEGYGVVEGMLNVNAAIDLSVSPIGRLFGNRWGIVIFFLLVIFLKVISMTLTNAGGGVGGTFGPTLFVGAMAGFVLVRSYNLLFAESLWTLPEQNFVLVGMAALMAGVMQAPMTSIFLIAEITGGYDLFLPLIAASTASFCITRIWEKHSIYTKRIAQRGDLLTHDSDQAVITLLKTSDLVRDKYPHLKAESTLADIMEIVSTSTAAVFPVLDDEGRFQGLVEMDDIRGHMFDRNKYSSIHVYNLMKQPENFVKVDEKMSSVISKFDVTDAWRLPVLDAENKYLGFISKSRILMAYREELKAIASED